MNLKLMLSRIWFEGKLFDFSNTETNIIATNGFHIHYPYALPVGKRCEQGVNFVVCPPTSSVYGESELPSLLN